MGEKNFNFLKAKLNPALPHQAPSPRSRLVPPWECHWDATLGWNSVVLKVPSKPSQARIP